MSVQACSRPDFQNEKEAAPEVHGGGGALSEQSDSKPKGLVCSLKPKVVVVVVVACSVNRATRGRRGGGGGLVCSLNNRRPCRGVVTH
jgi:hypothetical protein